MRAGRGGREFQVSGSKFQVGSLAIRGSHQRLISVPLAVPNSGCAPCDPKEVSHGGHGTHGAAGTNGSSGLRALCVLRASHGSGSRASCPSASDQRPISGSQPWWGEPGERQLNPWCPLQCSLSMKRECQRSLRSPEPTWHRSDGLGGGAWWRLVDAPDQATASARYHGHDKRLRAFSAAFCSACFGVTKQPRIKIQNVIQPTDNAMRIRVGSRYSWSCASSISCRSS